MKLRVLIADDEPLARARLRELIQSQPSLRLVAECADGKEALEAIATTSPDLVFLDVRMPELDGFAVLESLKGKRVPAVIFVTAHREFAVRAFEVQAVDYLLKPFDKERFLSALQRAQTLLRLDLPSRRDQLLSAVMASLQNNRKSLDRLPVKSGGRILMVPVSDIDFITAAGNYVELHVGKRSYLVRTKIKTLAEQLSTTQFLQISRSHLVNRDRISEVRSRPHGDYEVVLRGGACVPGSRTHRNKLAAIIN